MDVKLKIFVLFFLFLSQCCSLPNLNGCRSEDFPVFEDFDILKFLGHWYSVKISKHSSDVTEVTSSYYFVTTEKQLVMVERRFNNETGHCTDPVFHVLNKEAPGKYRTKSGSLHQIIYTEKYTHAVAVSCDGVDDDGQCLEDNITVVVMSRYDSVGVDVVGKLRRRTEALIGTCVVLHGFTSTDLCDISEDYLTFIGFVGWGNGNEMRCNNYRQVPVHKGFELDKFVGEWFSVTTTLYRHGWHTQTEESLVFFTDHRNNLLMAFRGYQERTGQCDEPMVLVLEEESPGKYLIQTETGIGMYQVIYTDNLYAITYSCSSMDNSGQCSRRHENFAVITRADPVSRSRVNDLNNYLKHFCVNTNTDIIAQQTGSCSVPKHFLAKYGFYKGCPVDQIPVAEDFDKEWFVGEWHVLKTSPMLLPGNTIYLNGIQNYYINNEYHLETAYIGYLDTQNICLKPGTITFQKERQSHFVFKTQAGTGIFKILYNDYYSAVTYSCRQTDSEGRCVSQFGHVSVLTRKIDSTDNTVRRNETVKRLQEYSWLACINSTHLKTVTSNLCSIPDEFLSQVRGRDKDPCQVFNIHILENIDMLKFVGVWNVIWSTEEIRGGETFISTTFNFFIESRVNLVMSTRQYRNSTDTCDEIWLSYLKEISLGNFRTETNETIVKILFTDYSETVLFICEQLDSNEVCVKEKAKFYILSRDHSVSKNKFAALAKYVSFLKMCTHRTDFVKQYSGLCLLSTEVIKASGFKGSISENCNGTNKIQPVPLNEISGEWYVLKTNRKHPSTVETLFSTGPVVWDAQTKLLNFIFRKWNKTSGKCVETHVSRLTEQSPGYFLSESVNSNVSVKILYHDYNVMLTVTCRGVVDDAGNCPTVNAAVDVWSQTRSLTLDQMRQLKRAMVDACFESNSLIDIESGVCHIPASVINFVRSDRIQTGYSAVGCHLDYFPVQKNLNISKVVGEWFVQYSTPDVTGGGRISQGPVYFSSDTNLTFLYRHWSEDKKVCKPTQVEKFFVTNSSETFTFVSHNNTGYFKVLYVDDSAAILYYCFSKNTEGFCLEGKAQIYVLTRTLDALTQSDMTFVTNKLVDVCIDPASLFKLESGMCSVPSHIKSAAVLPDNVGCQIKHILPQKQFDPKQMDGQWYTLYSSDKSAGDGMFVFGPWQVVTRNNDSILIKSKSKGGRDFCKPAEAVYLRQLSGSGEYSFTVDSVSGVFKVIYTDYQVAVTMTCYLATDDGFCQDKVVEVHSRSRDKSKLQLDRLLQHITDTCTDHHTMHNVTEDLCPVSDDYVLPASLGHLITQGSAVIGCLNKFIPVQKYFDLARFSGKWYTIYANKNAFHHQQGILGPIDIAKHGSNLVLLQSRFNDVTDECLPTESNYFEMTERAGNYIHLTNKATLKVLFTDYAHAVVYECFKVDAEGNCRQSELFVRILSRNKEISNSSLHSLVKHVTSVCVNLSDLEKVAKEECSVGKGVIQAAANGELTQGYEVVGCKPKFFTVASQFSESKLAGTWNVLLSTSLPAVISADWTTYNQWTFFTSAQTKLRLSHGFNFRTEMCGPTLSTVLSPGDQPGVYEFNDKGLNIYFKLLHFTESTGVVYLCMNLVTDGTCVEGFAALLIISKYNDIDNNNVAELENYMKETCLGQRTFQRIKGERCPLQEEILEAAKEGKITEDGLISCKVDYISQQTDISESQMSGVWNGVATTLKVDDVDIGPLLIVFSETTLVFAWRTYNKTSGDCKPTTVFASTKTETPGVYRDTSSGNLVLKVLHVDSELLIIYICRHVNTAGYCEDNLAILEMYSRQTTVPDSRLTELKERAARICVSVKSFTKLTVTKNCLVPANIIRAAEKNEFSLGEITVGCYKEYVSPQEDLDMSQFTGDNEWFTVMRSSSMFDEKPPPQKSKFVKNSHGDLFLFSSSYRSLHFACEPTEVLKLTERTRAGDYTFNMGGTDELSGVFKILYADNNYAVTYTCFDPTPNVECLDKFVLVEILSKTKDISDVIIRSLRAYIVDGCVDVSTLVKTMPDVCKIPDSIVKAVDNIQFNYSIPVVGCDGQIIQHQKDVNITSVAGTWHAQKHPATMIGRPMGESQTMYISLADNGIIVLWQDYMSQKSGEDPVCQPTRASHLLQRAGTGDYAAMAKHFSVIFKILYADAEHLVTYLCLRLHTDGSCFSGYMAVNILSRQLEISEDAVTELMKYFEGTCVSADDVVTLTPDLCQIPQAVIEAADSGDIDSEYVFVGCRVDFITPQNVKVSELTGSWNILYRPDRFLGFVLLDSKLLSIHDIGSGSIMQLSVSYNPESQVCQPVEQVKMSATDTPGEFTVVYNGLPGIAKVLYADATEAVWYSCFNFDNDNLCLSNSSFLEIWSRNSDIAQSKMSQLKKYTTCAAPVKKREPAPCVIPDNLKKAADIGSLTLDFAVTSFKTRFIPVQENFTKTQMEGKWYVEYKTVTAKSAVGEESVIFNFVLTPDGRMALLWTSYSDSAEQCIPVQMRVRKEMITPGSYLYPRPGAKDGTLKIVYTDYVNDAVVYLCLEVGDDGICVKSRLEVLVLSRTQNMSQERLEELDSFVRLATVQLSDLHKVKSDIQCEIPEEIVKSVQDGVLTYDMSQIGCHVDLIKAQPVEIKQIEGLWNVVVSFPSSWPQTVEVTSDSNNSIVYFSDQHNESSSGSEVCKNVTALKLEQVSEGYFKGIKNKKTVYFKVLYSTDSELVTYTCYETKKDGTCYPASLSFQILTRSDVISDEKLKKLKLKSVSVCLNSSLLNTVKQEQCKVPAKYIEIAKNGDIKTGFAEMTCLPQVISVQPNFDPVKFTGEWTTLRYVGRKPKSSKLTTYFAVNKDGVFTSIFSLSPTSSDECTTPTFVAYTQQKETGDYTNLWKSSTAYLKILHTDYETEAVLFVCYGTCHQGEQYVTISTKSDKVISDSRLDELMSLADVGCINTSQVSTFTGSCPIPSTLKEAAAEPTSELAKVVNHLTAASKCIVDELKTAPKMDLIQMSGHWYELARTRFTFNKMESVVIHHTYDSKLKMLTGVYTGSIDGKCQTPPIKSLTKTDPTKNQTAILGRIGGMKSDYPWISFKILHYDGTFLMYYSCYEREEAGACKPDKMEVTLLGRFRRKTERIEKLIPDLMSLVCLDPDHLIDTKQEVDCSDALFSGSTDETEAVGSAINPMKRCAFLSNMSVVNHFKEIEILGNWVGVAYQDNHHVYRGIHGFVVNISRNTQNSLRMNIDWRMASTDIKTLDVFQRNKYRDTVILKQRCRGTGDYISTYSSTSFKQWTSVKIVAVNREELVLYWCTKEQEGFCLVSGARIDVLSRSEHFDTARLRDITSAVHDDCFTASNFMIPLNTEDYYRHFLAQVSMVSAEPLLTESVCAVDNLPVVSIDVNRISGFWYEIAQIGSDATKMMSVICHYLPMGNGSMKFLFAGKRPDGQCMSMTGDLKPRCPARPDGHFLGRIRMPGLWSWNSWKVLYTDYDYATIAMSCMDEYEDGTCNKKGTLVHILSRSRRLDPDLKVILEGHLKAACLDLSKFVSSQQDGSCYSLLADIVKKIKT